MKKLIFPIHFICQLYRQKISLTENVCIIKGRCLLDHQVNYKSFIFHFTRILKNGEEIIIVESWLRWINNIIKELFVFLFSFQKCRSLLKTYWFYEYKINSMAVAYYINIFPNNRFSTFFNFSQHVYHLLQPLYSNINFPWFLKYTIWWMWCLFRSYFDWKVNTNVELIYSIIVRNAINFPFQRKKNKRKKLNKKQLTRNVYMFVLSKKMLKRFIGNVF